MSTKNARWGQQSALQVVLAASTLAAHNMFGGKTLANVGAEYDLGDEDVKWGIGINPTTMTEIRSLVLKVNGTLYQVPISRGLTAEMMASPDIMLNCVFRTGNLSVKDDAGNPTIDAEGNVVLDMTKPYMSFGRPSGIVIERMEEVFNEPVEGEIPADKLVGGAAAPAVAKKAPGAKK